VGVPDVDVAGVFVMCFEPHRVCAIK